MKDLEIFCDYFYKDSLIPIYIYDKQTLLACYPEQTKLTHPPGYYLDTLNKGDIPLTYITTNFNSFFGFIPLKDTPNIILVLGPVNNVPYSRDVLHSIYREYKVVGKEQNDLMLFFKNITNLTLISFLKKLLFINFSLNHTVIHIADILEINSPTYTKDIANKSVQNIFDLKESGSFNNSYEIEQKVINIIETGNIEGVKKFISNFDSVHEGIIALNALRQAKNITIVSITLATRAAIRGGLTTETAFQLSDLYIQQVEQLTTIQALNNLNYQVIYDFTNRVSNSQVPISKNDVIQRAIHYVIQNTNKRLSVSDVSAYVGFSRSYFTHWFKKELGFDLSTFIVRCKLEEAKYLLSYSNKSISEISNYLCFSSQSHFQTLFKKKYQMTPLEYRNNSQKT